MTAAATAGILLTAFLWGATNPILKLASKNVTTVRAKSKFSKLIKEFISLVTNWKYLVPFALNQSGSVIYIYTLQKEELSIIVPVTNSLTFVFTALSGWLLGEGKPNSDTFIGMILVIIGTTLCWMDKYY